MKTKFILLVSLIMAFSCQIVFAQQKPKNDNVKKDTVASHSVSDIVYATVEQMPGYPGGFPALDKAIKAKFGNAAIEKPDKEPIRVYASFTVTKKGEIIESKILKGANPELDAKVLDFINSMPKWIPGRANSKPVDASYAIPFRFWIEEK